MEKWKRIDWITDYKGTLEVSDHGRIRRGVLEYERRTRTGGVCTSTKPERILSLELGTHGYLMLAIWTGRKRRRFLAHRLVARAFVPGYEEALSVNHINGAKTDNRPDNLEWVTLAENTSKQWKMGLVDLRGENQPGAKLTASKVVDIRRMIASGCRDTEIGQAFGVSDSCIYLIRKGQRWRSVRTSE